MAWSSASSRTKTWGTEILTSTDLHTQFDLLHAYLNDSLNGSSGHGHTGGTSDGKPIVLTTAVTGTLPATNGGTGTATYAQGDILYSSAANTLSKLAAGTSGLVLKTLGAGANPLWADSLGSVSDYGTSASTSTAKQGTALKICYGKIDIVGSGTQAITNLPFTSSTSYQAVTCYSLGVNESPGIVYDSGAQMTITNNNSGTKTILWIALGT